MTKRKYIPMAKRCSVMNEFGRQCKREATQYVTYFGDSRANGEMSNWLRVKLCAKCAGGK